jgi:hypothetical protein
MVTWLEKKEFWDYFDSHYKPKKKYLNGSITVSLTEQQLRSEIQITPVNTPADEGDFPGPVLRWYGIINEELFIITYYIHPTISFCNVGDFTEISVASATAGKPSWSVIEPFLNNEGKFLIDKTVWIQSEYPNERIAVVKLTCPNGNEHKVYSALTIEEATQLVKALNSIGYCDFKYSVHKTV